MNCAALVVATHRIFEKAANGTSTREVTCIINEWRVRINLKGIYNVRSLPGKKDREEWGRRREQFV